LFFYPLNYRIMSSFGDDEFIVENRRGQLLIANGYGSMTSSRLITADARTGIITAEDVISGNLSSSNVSSNTYDGVDGIFTGNVGIGTTEPQANLHVVGTTQLDGLATTSDIVVTSTVGIGTAVAQTDLHVVGDALISSTVGIGTTSAQADLHVVGDALISSTVGIGTTTVQSDADLHIVGNVLIGAGTTIPLDGLYVLGNATVKDTFITQTGYISDLRALYSAGIGTTQPETMLHVVGESNLHGNVETTNVNVTGSVGVGTTQSTSNLHVIGDSNLYGNAETTNIHTSYAVGIGTTEPQANLHVEGTVQVYGISTMADALVTGTVGIGTGFADKELHVLGESNLHGNVDTTNVNVTGSVGVGTTQSTSNLHVIGTSNLHGNVETTNLHVNTAVGIGTTEPLFCLHVEGGPGDAYIEDRLYVATQTIQPQHALMVGGRAYVEEKLTVGGSGTIAELQLEPGDGTFKPSQIRFKARPNSLLGADDARSVADIFASHSSFNMTKTQYMSFHVAEASNTTDALNPERMRINSTGVGIGTTNPQVMLDVAGDSNIWSNTRTTNLHVTGAVGVGTTQAQTGYSLIVTDSSNTPLFAVPDSSTGLASGYTIVYDGTNWNYGASGGGGGGSLPTGTVDGQTLVWDSSTSDGIWTSNLVVTDSGNVGIGTTEPLSNLHVYGNALVTGKVGIGTTDTETYDLIVKDEYGKNLFAVPTSNANLTTGMTVVYDENSNGWQYAAAGTYSMEFDYLNATVNTSRSYGTGDSIIWDSFTSKGISYATTGPSSGTEITLKARKIYNITCTFTNSEVDTDYVWIYHNIDGSVYATQVIVPVEGSGTTNTTPNPTISFIYAVGSTSVDYYIEVGPQSGTATFNPMTSSTNGGGTITGSCMLSITEVLSQASVEGVSSQPSFIRAVVDVDTTATTDYYRYDTDDFLFSHVTKEGTAITYANNGTGSPAGTVFTLGPNKTYHMSFTTTDAAGNTFDIVYINHDINGTTVLSQMIMPNSGGASSNQFVNQGSVQFVYKTGDTSEDYVVNVFDSQGQAYFNPRQGYTALSIVELGTNAASYQLPNGTSTGQILKWDGSSWVSGAPSANYQGSFIRATVIADDDTVTRDDGYDMRFDSFTTEGASISYSQTGVPTTAISGRQPGTIFTLAANSTYLITFSTTDRPSNDFDYTYFIHWINSVAVAKQVIMPVSGYSGDYVSQPCITFTYKTGQTSEEYHIETDRISGGSGYFRPRNDGYTQLSITEVGLSVFGGADRIMVESGTADNQTLLWDNSTLQWNATSLNAAAAFDLYGTERVYWDVKSSPSGVVNLTGNATYATQTNNNYLYLVSGSNQTGRMYWTDGNNYKNWRLEIWVSLNVGNGPADYYWLWGEGTQTNSGGEGDTEGLVVSTDAYNGNTHDQANTISIYNGSGYTTLKSKSSMGVNPYTNTYTKFVLMRYGDEITYYIEGHESTIGYYRDKVSSSQNLSGTTYGIGASTGGEYLIPYIGTFRLTTL